MLQPLRVDSFCRPSSDATVPERDFMKFLQPLAAAFALCAVSPALAQTPATTDADPALWVVRDADTTIYLFGTVHVLKSGLSWFDEGVKAAYDKSDELVIEMVEPAPGVVQQAIMAKAVDPDGPALTDKLSPDAAAAFGEALGSLGMPPAAFDKFEPWFAAITLTVMTLPKLGYDINSGAEKVLQAAARQDGKPVGQLETLEQQLNLFDTLPEAAQIALLEETVEQFPTVGKLLDDMVGQWAKGDADSLARLMNESMRATPAIAKALLSDRNARWAEWVDARMDKPGAVFVAVGAGHLAGADSVQAMLAKRGLKAERVAY